MAKRTRRARAASPMRYAGPRSATSAAGITLTPTAVPAIRARGGGAEPTKSVNFAEEYRYVYQDLRRVAVLAGTILIILVALSFVIR